MVLERNIELKNKSKISRDYIQVVFRLHAVRNSEPHWVKFARFSIFTSI